MVPSGAMVVTLAPDLRPRTVTERFGILASTGPGGGVLAVAGGGGGAMGAAGCEVSAPPHAATNQRTDRRLFRMARILVLKRAPWGPISTAHAHLLPSFGCS